MKSSLSSRKLMWMDTRTLYGDRASEYSILFTVSNEHLLLKKIIIYDNAFINFTPE